MQVAKNVFRSLSLDTQGDIADVPCIVKVMHIRVVAEWALNVLPP